MKTEKITRHDHRDDIESLVEECPAEWSGGQLQSIRPNGDRKREPNAVARQPRRLKKFCHDLQAALEIFNEPSSHRSKGAGDYKLLSAVTRWIFDSAQDEYSDSYGTIIEVIVASSCVHSDSEVSHPLLNRMARLMCAGA